MASLSCPADDELLCGAGAVLIPLLGFIKKPRPFTLSKAQAEDEEGKLRG